MKFPVKVFTKAVEPGGSVFGDLTTISLTYTYETNKTTIGRHISEMSYNKNQYVCLFQLSFDRALIDFCVAHLQDVPTDCRMLNCIVRRQKNGHFFVPTLLTNVQIFGVFFHLKLKHHLASFASKFVKTIKILPFSSKTIEYTVRLRFNAQF